MASAQGSGTPAPEVLDTSRPVRLDTRREDRERIEELAELYSVLKATEMLEAAFEKGHVSAEAYTPAASGLISSFQMQERTLRSKQVIKDAQGVRQFMARYGLQATRAEQRLLEDAVPATAMHSTAAHGFGAAEVHATTMSFITLHDAVTLDESGITVLTLQPMLTELMGLLQKHANLPVDHPSKTHLNPWLQRLRAMEATDSLSEADSANLLLAVSNSHTAFKRELG